MSSATTDRQLELTLNALARSVRKVLRLAEQQDPTGQQEIWNAVEQRLRLFQDFLKVTRQFAAGQKPESEIEPNEVSSSATEAEEQTAAENVIPAAIEVPLMEEAPKIPQLTRKERRALQQRDFRERRSRLPLQAA